MTRLAWLGAWFAAGVAFALPRVLHLEGELEAREERPPPERPPPSAEFLEHEGYLYPVDPARHRGLPVLRPAPEPRTRQDEGRRA